MPHLPVVSGDEFVKAMRKIGYVWDHTEGSHMILYHPFRTRLTVPRHKELSRGLIRALIRDAALTPDEFAKLLKD
jgi:predicted RNA binding protein YcfA (HicA-like mRNA interferase family)